MEWGLDPSWGSSTLWTYLSFLPSSCPSTLWTMVLTLRGVRPPCGLKFNFLTLVGFVHVVDLSLDPPWGPSTLWTYLSFLPLLGPSTLWTGVLTLDGVCPLCGHICFLPLLGPSTLWTGVLILDGIRPLCGLIYVFDPCWGPSTL